MDYDHTKDPEPKYFEEILRNSLSEDDIKRFCTDFLALFRPKPHKQPVACAIGPADSGKTSLFSPVFQIVPLNRIARVTKQKNFNKAMIDRYTEVIFLDEAFAGLLDMVREVLHPTMRNGKTQRDFSAQRRCSLHARPIWSLAPTTTKRWTDA